MKLRSAEELLTEYNAGVTGIVSTNDKLSDVAYATIFDVKRILSAHTSDIRKVIEEKILYLKSAKEASNNKFEKTFFEGVIQALTEILEILKEKQ